MRVAWRILPRPGAQRTDAPYLTRRFVFLCTAPVQIAHFVEDFSGARRLRRLTSPTACGAFRLVACWFVAHRSGVNAALLLLRLRRVASSASNQGPRPAAWITAFFPGSKASTTCG